MNTTFFTSNNTGDATAPDQWGGTAGNGWVGPWQVDTGGSIVRNKRVLNTGGLTAGAGNYVQFESSAADGFRRWANTREYTTFGDFALDQAATFEFLYRPDDISNFASGGSTFVELMDGGAIFSPGVTWVIRSVGGATKSWGVNDGNQDSTLNLVNSGLEIIEGDTYRFTIASDPLTQTYDISIDNLDDALPAFTQTGLGYNQNVSEHAGKLVFSHQVTGAATDNSYTYSLDSVSIVPEPGSLALMGLGSLALLRRGRQR